VARLRIAQIVIPLLIGALLLYTRADFNTLRQRWSPLTSCGVAASTTSHHHAALSIPLRPRASSSGTDIPPNFA
jgi:hypothetical protein